MKHWLFFLFCTQWWNWTSHISQTKGCLRGTQGGRGELMGQWIAWFCVGRVRLSSSTSQTQKLSSPCKPQGVSLPGNDLHDRLQPAQVPLVPSMVWFPCASSSLSTLCSGCVEWGGCSVQRAPEQPHTINNCGSALPPAERGKGCGLMKGTLTSVNDARK